MGQATIFPTLFDLMGLRWAPAVADLDSLAVNNADFIVRNRKRFLMNRVFDFSSAKVDEALQIPMGERRGDLYRTQDTIPYVHPNGYYGPGMGLRDSTLKEGYSPLNTYPPSQFVPRENPNGNIYPPQPGAPGAFVPSPGGPGLLFPQGMLPGAPDVPPGAHYLVPSSPGQPGSVIKPQPLPGPKIDFKNSVPSYGVPGTVDMGKTTITPAYPSAPPVRQFGPALPGGPGGFPALPPSMSPGSYVPPPATSQGGAALSRPSWGMPAAERQTTILTHLETPGTHECGVTLFSSPHTIGYYRVVVKSATPSHLAWHS
jgi:hypothetical protein